MSIKYRTPQKSIHSPFQPGIIRDESRYHLLIGLLFILVLSSCSGALYTYPSLVQRGILPLSTTNAYQGANLFLSRELEKSSFLFRFFESKGAPRAIEIKEETLGKPELNLYYPGEGSVYVGDLNKQGANRQWIMRGPYGMNRFQYSTLRKAGNMNSGSPLFELYGSPFRFSGNNTTRVAKNLEADIPYIPAPKGNMITRKPKPKASNKKEETVKSLKKKKQTKKKTITYAKVPTFDDKHFIPKNSDQRALLIAQGYAPRDSNGDILHSVRHNRDTLSVIVEWYTGSKDNYAAIMKFNKIDDSKPLKRRSTVRIPLDMIVKTKLLPDD